ncbi:ATP-dependent helicase [Oribacterium sp. Sow4_G1_1]|uniref:ATP-dependent helicase n=1 Tax=Oribacterium sp. Sow4_G1_1 TaxID=3438794 RepID=UPI003F9DE073
MTWTEFTSRFPIQLNQQQESAVQSVEGPVLLLAVPGSGKTTVLVTRLGYMIFCKGIAPERILTVTYTVAATKDMAERFACRFGAQMAGRLEFRTINGICARVIQYCSWKSGRTAFSLLTDEKRIAAMLAGIYQRIEHSYPTESDLQNVRTLITFIKNRMLGEEEIRTLEKDAEIQLLRIYKAYNAELREHQLMDYDDQMVYAYTMLQRFPWLREHFQQQYPYICVDEAQDTSKIQHAIIALLASRTENLFMVGDEDQSIYGFRAAYPDALLEFEQHHPGARVLLMEENFRSDASIVRAADRFIQKNTLRHEKHMQPARPKQREIREIPLANRKAQYSYLLKVAEGCTAAYAADQEQRAVAADEVKERADGGPATDTLHADRRRSLSPIAVLYRDHECALPLIDLLERNGVPYKMRNADIGFFTNRVVLDICNIIRLAENPLNTELFMQLYYKLGTYLRKQDAQSIADISQLEGLSVWDVALKHGGLNAYTKGKVRAIQTHMRNLRKESAGRAVYRIVEYMGYREYMERSEIKDTKLDILRILADQEDSPRHLVDRLEKLRQVLKEKSSERDCPFILSTIHASKGLEYDSVYLLDVIDGVLPAQIPKDLKKAEKAELEAYEEERRLFYVGITRAKDQLYVFTMKTQHSSFCDELFQRMPKKSSVKPAPTYSGTAPSSWSGYISITGRNRR